MMGWRSGFRKGMARAVAAIGAVALAGCASARAQPETARPALWKLSDADTTIYLFGTIHLLPKGMDWRTPALAQAIDASDELVLETAMGTDLAATGRKMMEMGLSPGLPPVMERVPEDKRAALATLIESAGIPGGALDRMETWAAAMSLFASSFRSMGFEAKAGVEQGLAAQFRKADKPMSGLETVAQQFGFFDTLSEESQRAFLVGSIDDPEKAKAQFEEMMKAWAAGDVEAIARTFDSETGLSPELRAVLMTNRNRAWADWLEARLDTPGTVLVAVGAGHLAGRDSVQAMLEAKGLKAERVQ